MQHKCLWFIKE